MPTVLSAGVAAGEWDPVVVTVPAGWPHEDAVALVECLAESRVLAAAPVEDPAATCVLLAVNSAEHWRVQALDGAGVGRTPHDPPLFDNSGVSEWCIRVDGAASGPSDETAALSCDVPDGAAGNAPCVAMHPPPVVTSLEAPEADE